MGEDSFTIWTVPLVRRNHLPEGQAPTVGCGCSEMRLSEMRLSEMRLSEMRVTIAGTSARHARPDRPPGRPVPAGHPFPE
jgi:hypothetical protein